MKHFVSRFRKRNLILKGSALALLAALSSAESSKGQTLYDSFSDGNFTASPVWNTGGGWTVAANSDAGPNATGSQTLRLSVASGSGTKYLSSQIATWGASQEWGIWIGRRAQALTGANQSYFWLYANEADLNSATVDGYRIAIGDDTGGDEIRLEYILNGAVNATVITSTGSIPNSTTDIGFLVRVTRSSSGGWALFSSTLPTASGGESATAVPNSTNAGVAQGTGTNASLVPASNGYIGIGALHSSGTNGLVGAEFDQVYFTPTLANSPSLSVSVGSLPGFGNVTVGAESAAQSFTVTGSNLTNNTTVTAPAGNNFVLSTSSAGTYTSSISLPPAGGDVFVKFVPATQGAHSGNIVISNPDVSPDKTVSVSGTGVCPTVTIAAGGPTTFCTGGSVTLSTTPVAGATYTWSSGQNTSSIVATTTGTYSLTVNFGNGCVITSNSIPVTVNTFSSSSTLFTENFGTATSFNVITYTGYQNDATLNYGNGGVANPAEIRTSSPSTTVPTYSGASGNSNVFFTSISGTYGFSIEDINAASYSGLNLQFGFRKESGAILPNLAIDYWNGASWVSVPFSFGVTAAAQQGWYQTPLIPLPAGANINGLKIRWVKTGGTAVRIDDVVLKSINPAGLTISTAGAAAICGGTPINLTSSLGNGIVWSTGQTSQIITVNSANTYSVTATDANGCTATATQEVLSGPVPAPVASSNSNLCSGGTIFLTASGLGGSSFSWTGPNGFVATGTNPTITNATPANSGNYTVTEVTSVGCTAIAVTSVSVQSTATLNGPNYTVNAALAPSTLNFTSFSSLADVLNSCGVSGPVTVTVAPGTYNDVFWLNNIPGSSATNVVTLNGSGAVLERCVQSASQNVHIIELNGTDNVIINNLNLDATCRYGTGIRLMNGTNNITISNNTIDVTVPGPNSTSVHNKGIYITDGGTVTITGNTITGGRRGIEVTNQTGVLTVDGNTFTQAYEYGIGLVNAANAVVTDNLVQMRNGYSVSLGFNALSANNLTLERNYFFNAGRAGIQLQNSTGGSLVNNRVGFFQTSDKAYGMYLYNVSAMEVYHNSLMVDKAAIGNALRVGNSGNLDVRNNIFEYSASGGGVPLYGAPASFSQLAQNDYYNANGGPIAFLNQSVLDLAAMALLGYNTTGSFTVDPNFSAAVTFADGMRTNNATLADVPAAQLLAAVDFEMETRSAGSVSLGADEFGVNARLMASSTALPAEVYPNPFQRQLSVQLNEAQAGSVQVMLTDLMGRQVMARTFSVEAGVTSVQLNVEQELAQGVYLLQVTQGEATSTFRVVKQ